MFLCLSSDDFSSFVPSFFFLAPVAGTPLVPLVLVSTIKEVISGAEEFCVSAPVLGKFQGIAHWTVRNSPVRTQHHPLVLGREVPATPMPVFFSSLGLP